MKRAILAITILILGLSAADAAPSPNYTKVKVRVTYWTHTEKNYTWGTKVASNPRKRATEGSTCATDPSKIPFGTKIYIPELGGIVGNGIFVVDDTGSAVKKMQAIPKSKRSEIKYVIDIYVDSNAKMNKLARANPHYMEVYIFNKAIELASTQ